VTFLTSFGFAMSEAIVPEMCRKNLALWHHFEKIQTLAGAFERRKAPNRHHFLPR
jgi:hypothetical protein